MRAAEALARRLDELDVERGRVDRLGEHERHPLVRPTERVEALLALESPLAALVDRGNAS